MQPFAKPLCRQLAVAVVVAREIAETAVRAALMPLGVGESDPRFTGASHVAMPLLVDPHGG